MDLTVNIVDLAGAPLVIDHLNINGVIYANISSQVVTIANCTEDVIIHAHNGGYYYYINYINLGTANNTFVVTMLSKLSDPPEGPVSKQQIIQTCDCCYDVYYSSSNEGWDSGGGITSTWALVDIRYDADAPNGPTQVITPSFADTSDVTNIQRWFKRSYCYPEGNYNPTTSLITRSTGATYNADASDAPLVVNAGSLAACSDSVVDGVILNRLVACCPKIEIDSIDLDSAKCAYSGQTMKITVDALFPYEVGCASAITISIVNETTGEDIYSITDGPVTSDSDSYNLWNSNPYIVELELPAAGRYIVTLTATNCNDEVICERTVDSCATWQIVKNGCHKYHVCNLFPDLDLSGLQLTVTNYAEDYSKVYLFSEVGEAGTGCFSITTPKDDVYILDLVDLNADPAAASPESIAKLIIYDICDYSACYNALMKELLCTDTTPCCEDCLSKEREKEIHLELMKLSSLYNYAYTYINKERIEFINIFDIDECRDKILASISDIFTKLREITNRCAKCDDSTTSTTAPSGCTSC